MILGYSTNAFVKYTLVSSLEKIAELGFWGVEIMCDRPHLYPPDYLPQNSLGTVKESVEQNGLTVTNLNSFTLFAVGDTYLPSWIEPLEERRNIRIQHTLDCLEMAAELNCRNISIPPGGPLGPITRKEALKMFYAGLEKVIPRAESLNIKILVEPEPGLLIERTSEFRDFMKEIQSPAVGLNFDIGHFFCAGENPACSLEELFAWVGHIHIEDIGKSRTHHHLIVGDGAIDFPEVFAAMHRLGYDRHISLELYPYENMPEEAGRKSLEHLRPLFEKAGLLVQ
jgi:sugar phosphate isomerase/epimerase